MLNFKKEMEDQKKRKKQEEFKDSHKNQKQLDQEFKKNVSKQVKRALKNQNAAIEIFKKMEMSERRIVPIK